jgi:hypothetical protein
MDVDATAAVPETAIPSAAAVTPSTATPNTSSMLAAQPGTTPAPQPQQQQQQQSNDDTNEAGTRLRQHLKQRALLLKGTQAHLRAQLLLEASVWGVQGYPGRNANRKRWGMAAVAGQLQQAARQRREERATAARGKKLLLDGVLKWHKVGRGLYTS